MAASDGLPGWTVFLGTTQESQVLHNYTYLGLASVDILGPSWTYLPNTEPGILGGKYSVYLQAGTLGGGNPPFVSASIAQAGLIPTSAMSLQFKAWEEFGGEFSVSFDGNNLPITLLSVGQSSSGQMYDVYGADIAPYAGESGTLEFTEQAGNGNSLLLDDIGFSTVATPEPGPLWLMGMAAGAGLTYRRWRRKG